MGPLSIVPASADAHPDKGLRVVPRSAGAESHHNLSTIPPYELEELIRFLVGLRPSAVHDDLHAFVAAADYPVLERAIDAALVTAYHELVVRGGRAIFAGGDNLDLVDIDDVVGIHHALEAGARCESPVCHLAHDPEGRHVWAGQ